MWSGACPVGQELDGQVASVSALVQEKDISMGNLELHFNQVSTCLWTVGGSRKFPEEIHTDTRTTRKLHFERFWPDVVTCVHKILIKERCVVFQINNNLLKHASTTGGYPV